MESERYYNTPIFKDDLPEPPIYRCGWCGEDSTDEEDMRHDHTINGNICLHCLENDEDHQWKISMNNYEYHVYKTRVLQSKPNQL